MIEPAKFERVLSQIATKHALTKLNVWFGNEAKALVEEINLPWLAGIVDMIVGKTMGNWDDDVFYWRGRVPMPVSDALTPFFCMVEQDKTLSIWFNDQKNVNEIMERMKALVGTETEAPKPLSKDDFGKLFGEKNEGRFGFGSVNLN